MNKLLNTLQGLGQKATQIKQAVGAAPATAAQLRESILLTAGQLQQIRGEVQATVSGLRADTEPRLTQALQELDSSRETLLEAGYALAGIDIELSPVQRLIVHLERLGLAPDSSLESLRSRHAHKPTLHALLSALAKADELAAGVRLPDLQFRELIVHIGPSPSIRLCWRPEAVPSPAAASASPPPAAPVPSPTPTSTPPPLPTFGQGSFFEPRSTPPAAPPSSPQASPAAPIEPAPVPAGLAEPVAPRPTASPTATSSGSDWKTSALDRFKKMPDASKYRRG